MRKLIAVALCSVPLALCVGGGVVALAVPPTTHQAPRVCFDRDSWSPAADALRPCVRIVRLYEDGSFKYRVSDANGTVRYSGGVGALDR